MSKEITAQVSLSKEEWGLLMMFIHQSSPMLPKNSWDVATKIEDAINHGLENPISKDTQARITYFRHALKCHRNDIVNLKSQIKKLKSNYRFTNAQFNCLG